MIYQREAAKEQQETLKVNSYPESGELASSIVSTGRTPKEQMRKMSKLLEKTRKVSSKRSGLFQMPKERTFWHCLSLKAAGLSREAERGSVYGCSRRWEKG